MSWLSGSVFLETGRLKSCSLLTAYGPVEGDDILAVIGGFRIGFGDLLGRVGGEPPGISYSSTSSFLETASCVPRDLFATRRALAAGLDAGGIPGAIMLDSPEKSEPEHDPSMLFASDIRVSDP